MRELPSGTVTFLFTDIEGSTKLLHELGDAYADALAEHRRVLRDAFERHGGAEVDTQGDAFFVAFARAGDALAAAREGQDALAPGRVRVRMGVHTGEPIVTDEGYVGIDVHRAARIAGVGHGGQVLVSQSTRELVGLDGRLALGEHRLKDRTAPERIYQLGDTEFPPLKSLNQSNLPEQPTPFVGREKELGEVLALLAGPKTRLLTLTGPGGSGKTRLAVQGAAETTDQHEHGVWWIGLQAVRDPELVVPAIGSALGAKGDVAEHIGDRRMLLVLYNLEQVVAAAPALGELLAVCRNVRLITTSREPLRLGGEVEYAVPPFVEQEAVGFFLGRARAVRRDFEPDERVLEICRRLDNLPLALELAAARVRALSSAQILERLERSLPLLTGGARDAPERQRPLRGTISWSYDLLSPDEQRALRSLGVFAGGCTLEAAEEVAGADIDLLQSLVEKSLIRFGDERYSLLETIREFAVELLEEAEERDEARRRHTDFFFRLAESMNMSAEAGYGLNYEALPPELDNLRAALGYAIALGEPPLAVELMVMLENFWVTLDPFEGARRWSDLFAAEPELPDQLRARALRCYAGSLWMSGGYEESHRLNEESLALFRELRDEEGVAVMLHRIGISTMQLDDREKARELLEESLATFRRLGSKRGEAEGIGALGYLAQTNEDYERAIDLYARSAELSGQVGFTWWQVGMLANLAECLLELGRPEEAEAPGRESLAHAQAIGDRQSKITAIALLAATAVAQHDPVRAGRLWGALEAEEARGPVGQWETMRPEYAERVLAAGPEFSRACEEGRQVPFERAVEEALAG